MKNLSSTSLAAITPNIDETTSTTTSATPIALDSVDSTGHRPHKSIRINESSSYTRQTTKRQTASSTSLTTTTLTPSTSYTRQDTRTTSIVKHRGHQHRPHETKRTTVDSLTPRETKSQKPKAYGHLQKTIDADPQALGPPQDKTIDITTTDLPPQRRTDLPPQRHTRPITKRSKPIQHGARHNSSSIGSSSNTG